MGLCWRPRHSSGRLAALDGALAVILEIAAATFVFLHVATVTDPVETKRRQAFLRIALWGLPCCNP